MIVQTPEMEALVGDRLRRHLGEAQLDRFLLEARIAVLERETQRLRNENAALQERLTPGVPGDG